MKTSQLAIVATGIIFVGLLVGLGATGMAAATTVDSNETVVQTQDDTIITSSDVAEPAPTDGDIISWAGGAGAAHAPVDDGDSRHAERQRISVDQELEVGPDSGHMLEITNEDTGESIEMVFTEEGTLDGNSIDIGPYDVTGDLVGSVTRVDDIEVSIEGDETIFNTERVANYRVTLYQDGVEQGATPAKPFGIGYTLDAEVTDTDGTIEIAVPRDEMPADALTTLELGVPGDDDLVNDPLHSATLEYDADRDVFYTSFDATELERDEYSWRVVFYEDDERLDNRLLFTFGFDPLAVGAGDGDNGDGEDPVEGVNIGLEPAEQVVNAGEQTAFDITVEGATDGIDAYEAVIELTNADVATIAEFTHEQDPGADDTQISADGSQLDISAAMLGNPIAGADEITLGTIIVDADAEGETVLDTGDIDVTQDGESYAVNDVSDGLLAVEGEITDPAISLGLADENINQGEDTKLTVDADDVTNGVSEFAVTIQPDAPDRVNLSDVVVEGDADPDVTELDDGSLVIEASPNRANGDLELAALTVTGVGLGETSFSINDVTVIDADGNAYEPRSLSGTTLTVEDADDTVNIDLRAGDDEVPVGTETTVDVVLESAGAGIGAFEFDVDVTTPETARITAFEHNQDPQFDNTELAPDGSTVQFSAGMGNNVYEPADETLVATLTIQAEAAGDMTLEVDDADVRIDDADGDTYATGTLSGTNFEAVTGPPPVVGDNPPQDLNGDGNFEDIDGDGEFTVFDVQTLFNNLETDPIQDNPDAFNFAGDEDPDEVTVFDVQALFAQLQEQDN